MSLRYLGKHEPGNCLFSNPQACVFSWRMLVAACMREGQRSSLWTFALTNRLKRHNFRVHASLGSAETLVRRGGIINHQTETERIIAIQSYPRSLILAPIETAYATSYWSSIVILVLSCPVSETLLVFCWEDRPQPYSTRILGCSPLTRLSMLRLRGAKTLSLLFV